jgi:nucleotide-binding universal stress UspA family protein
MNVLVAIDDSVYSTACVRAVAERPWPRDTKLRVLSVTGVLAAAPLPAETTGGGAPKLGSTLPLMAEQTRHVSMIETARQVAERGADALRARGLTTQLRVRDGTPASQIIEEAIEWPADLIVVGTRGRSAIKRILLGSVANYVVQHAPCSVEIVRERERA